MTRVTEVKLLDDLDGSAATETVQFSVDRKHYEIDLSSDHAAALRDAVAPYRDAARPLSGRSRNRATSDSSSAGTRAQNQAIRAWARAHGHAVPDRGRIPARIATAFRAGSPASPPAQQDERAEPSRTATTAGRTDEQGPAARRPKTEEAATAETGVSTDTPSVPATADRGGLTKAERETIRAWAQEQGIEVKPRGQLKQDLVSNYRAWAKRVGHGN